MTLEEFLLPFKVWYSHVSAYNSLEYHFPLKVLFSRTLSEP